MSRVDSEIESFKCSLRALVERSNPANILGIRRGIIKTLREEAQSLARQNQSSSTERAKSTATNQIPNAQSSTNGSVCPQIDGDLVEIAKLIETASRIIVFVGAGISTSCGIPDFRSETGLHRTSRSLFDREVLDSDAGRADLFRCLKQIRDKATSSDLKETDTHGFLRGLSQSGKLQRCYTQNFDGLEVRAGLNADLDSSSCSVIQLHGNLDYFRCSYCSHITIWDVRHETELIGGSHVPCPACARRVEDRRRRGARTNIHVGHLRPNIVLYGEVLDPFSEKKAAFIDADARSQFDLLLVLGTSLAADGPRSELKKRLIPAVHRSRGRAVYVNRKPPPSAFSKPLFDHIFTMDCDRWVCDLAAVTDVRIECARQDVRHPVPGEFQFKSKATTVEKVIEHAERSLISIGDYSGISFRPVTRQHVREDLSPFLPGKWLTTTPLMCILSLFRWRANTLLLHSELTAFDLGDAEARATRLKGSIWPVGRSHERVIIPHNPHNHWILVVADLVEGVIGYYSSLPGYDMYHCCMYIQAQLKRAGQHLGKEYAFSGPPIERSSHRQTNASDCGIYLLENARRISQGDVVDGAPVDAAYLRVFFAELILARSLHEVSEHRMLKSLLLPDAARSWQVGTAPRSYTFPVSSTRAKRRKLEISDIAEQVEADASSDGEGETRSSRPTLARIEANISRLPKASPACLWSRQLGRLALCQIGNTRRPLGHVRAARLLHLVAAFACPEQFVMLKNAIIQYRALGPATAIGTAPELSSHMYAIGVWTERLGMMNAIIQRFVRAHFTSLIEDGVTLFRDQAEHSLVENGSGSLKRVIKAMVVKMFPQVNGWDLSTDPVQKTMFAAVERNLRKWRREGTIWSLLQRRFFSLAVLALAPYQIQADAGSPSISATSSFQSEIPNGIQEPFVEALAELQPCLWDYIPRLGHLFDIISNPVKLHDHRFKIEFASDESIRQSPPSSELFVRAFEYSTKTSALPTPETFSPNL